MLADVHGGALADRLQALEDLNVLCLVLLFCDVLFLAKANSSLLIGWMSDPGPCPLSARPQKPQREGKILAKIKLFRT